MKSFIEWARPESSGWTFKTYEKIILQWIISSGQLCTQNILNAGQKHNTQHNFLSGNSSQWHYDMKSASGEVLYPNMNAFRAKEKTNAYTISWLHLAQMLFQCGSSHRSKLKVNFGQLSRINSKDFSNTTHFGVFWRYNWHITLD